MDLVSILELNPFQLVQAALLGGTVVYGLTRQVRGLRSMNQVAAGLGMRLSDNRASVFSREWTLTGAWRGHPVSVRYGRRTWTDKKVPCITVELSGVHLGLGLRAETTGDQLRGGSAGDLRTGDAAFDRSAFVWGDELVARALLDAPTRAAALAVLARAGAEVSGGTVELSDVSASVSLDAVRVLLDEAADLADRIGPGAWSEDRLLGVALADPEPAVRARALMALWERGDPALRLRAIDATRGHEDPVCAAIGALMSDTLARVQETPPQHVIAAANFNPSKVSEALERLGAEDALCALLGSEVLPVQLAAVAALGRVGSVRAVEPLRPLTQGLTRDGELKRLAREAVQRVQARLGEVSPGGLSLVDGGAEAGRLSVPEAQGALSMAAQRERG